MSASLQLVPDWADHSYCWMAWVVHPEWGKSTPSVKKELREVILTISKYEPVRLLTPPSFVFEARLEFVGANVEIVVAPVDDIWMRDIAPIYALHGTQSVPIDLNFNGWGSTEYRRSRAGDRLAGVCRHLFGEGVVHASFVAEGGAFVVGSNQLVLTTLSCLLNQNRNPFLNEQQIESGLLRLGARKVIWLKGDKNEKITAGHVDGYLLPTEFGKGSFSTIRRNGTFKRCGHCIAPGSD